LFADVDRPILLFASPIFGNSRVEPTPMVFRFSAAAGLEHVPKKLIDFFDEDMLQLFEFERFLFDPMIPRDREAL
jgi:hypothetical protein